MFTVCLLVCSCLCVSLVLLVYEISSLVMNLFV